MKTKAWKKPLACRIGQHSYRAIAPPQTYTVEMQCERCGQRKIMALNTGSERFGPP